MAAIKTRPILFGFSNWNAAANPVVYTLQREDCLLEDSGGAVENDGSGNARIIIESANGDVSSYFSIGNTIYFVTVDSAYATHAVVTASTFDGTNTKVTVDYPYSTNGGTGSSGFIINISKRTDWKLYVNFTDLSSNNILPSDITFSPDTTGLIRVDASILKNYLTADVDVPSADNEPEVGTDFSFFLKATEFYDNTLSGFSTIDSGFPVHVVFGAMQVGSENGGNMFDYLPGSSTKKFLQKFQPSTAFKKMVMWRGWPFTISFIYPSGMGTVYRLVTQYDASGSTISALTYVVLNTDNAINRMVLPAIDANSKRVKVYLYTNSSYASVSVSNSSFVATISPWSSVNHGLSVADPWTWEAGDWLQCVVGDGSNFQSQYLESPTHAQIDSGLPVRITTVVLTDSADPSNLFVTQLWNGSAWISGGGPADIAVSGSDQSIVVTFNAPFSFTKFRILVSGSATSYDYKIKSVTLEKGVPAQMTEELDIEIRDACGYNSDYEGVLFEKNPIHLFWKNSVGGDAWWNFEAYHEYQYSYSNGKKAKRIQLFASQVHPVQWEALQDLNTNGVMTSVNITELTSSVIATSKRAGQQVYIVSKDGTKKTGVIVIPTSDTASTKDAVNIFSVTIELPEVFSI
jgi:hypothetical protein